LCFCTKSGSNPALVQIVYQIKQNLIKTHCGYVNRFSPQAHQGMPVGDLKRAHYCGSYAIVAPRM